MRKGIFLAMVALVVVASLGCISEKKAPEGMTLRIGYQPSTHQIAEMVAMDKGWWLEELKPFGVTKVEDFEFPSGPPEMLAMQAGELDIAYVGTAPPITAIDKGLKAKIVAGVNLQGSDLVVKPGINYTDPASLIGLSVGTFPPSSIQDTVLRKWLMDNGVNASALTIMPMGPGDAVTAISAKQIDSVFLPHPSPSVIELEGKGTSVVQSGEMWPDHACCSLVVSDELIAENPEMVQKIVEIHIKATDYCNQHPDEAAEIYSNRTGQDLDMVKYSIQHWDGKWISDPRVQIESTLSYAAVDKELGYINKTLTEKDLFDTSIYEKVTGK